MNRRKIIKVMACSFMLGFTSLEVGIAQAQSVRNTATIAIKHVSAKQAAVILQQRKDIVVLDIRTPNEYRHGHINGAKNINYYSLNFRSQIAKLKKDVTYLVYCAAGYRSSWSLSILQAAGLNEILHMEDGLNAWKRAKLPLIE